MSAKKDQFLCLLWGFSCEHSVFVSWMGIQYRKRESITINSDNLTFKEMWLFKHLHYAKEEMDEQYQRNRQTHQPRRK